MVQRLQRIEAASLPKHIAGSNRRPARGPSPAVGSDGGRSFSKPRTVFAGEGHLDALKIMVDNKGTMHLVYAGSPAGPLQQYHFR